MRACLQPPNPMPNVLIPLVVHVMMYNDGGSSYGPPSYASACSDFVPRLVRVANYQAKPSKFQFFVQVR